MNAEPTLIERHYRATLAEVWNLWTTKPGIESWWGPEGFSVTVTAMDLRAGGSLAYDMTATGAQQVAYMKAAGMPVTTPARITYTAVSPMTRLAYDTMVDFVPGIVPYAVSTELDLTEVADGVRMVLRSAPMHDAEWTGRAVAGCESQVGRLDTILGV